MPQGPINIASINMTNGLASATLPLDSADEVEVQKDGKRYKATVADLAGAVGGSNAVAQTQPANPTGTTSTTAVMMGLAGAITPANTGRVLAILSGDIFNAGAIADGASVQLAQGTGTAPANGDAATGTAVGGVAHYVASTTAGKAPFSVQAVVTGLTVGTAAWFDAQVAAATGGTATIENLSLTLVEV